jgi:hypothetical protein
MARMWAAAFALSMSEPTPCGCPGYSAGCIVGIAEPAGAVPFFLGAM